MWLYYRCTELDRQFWRVRLNHLQICPTILHNFIEHSPSWGPKRFSATEEITCILHIPKVHYRMHKSPSLAPVLSLINSVHAPEYSFYYAHFNILPCTLRYSMWSLFMRFPHQNPVWNFLSLLVECPVTYLWTFDPCGWDRHAVSKRRASFTQWLGAKSQKLEGLNCTAVNSSFRTK